VGVGIRDSCALYDLRSRLPTYRSSVSRCINKHSYTTDKIPPAGLAFGHSFIHSLIHPFTGGVNLGTRSTQPSPVGGCSFSTSSTAGHLNSGILFIDCASTD